MDSQSGQHWNNKIPEYLKQSWSNSPSPFARFVKPYFKTNAKILEIGTGAGQDGLWFCSQGYDVTLTDASDVAFDSIRAKSKSEIKLEKVDITKTLPFQEGSFDVVYAQLVLHYFNDEMMNFIISEIQQVLSSGGLLACMVNSTKDPEYDQSLENEDHLIKLGKLQKRFFSPVSFQPFVTEFDTIVLDDKGRTPKDDDVSTSGMIRFIGKRS